MQQFTPKMWSAAGLAAAAAVVAATPVQAADPYKAPEEMFPGSFDRALELMLMGEGGESGIGMNRVWPTATVPALSSEQIRKAVPGNSLTIEHHYSLQFAADGKVGGYHLAYADAPLSKCPKKEVLGDGFLLHEGGCHIRTEMPWSGSWRIDSNRLCLTVNWENGGKVDDCYTVFFMLDSVGLVQSDGRLWGKAHKLKKGFAPDEG